MVSSWVQVGPGKYVRIEGPAPVAPAGRDSHDLESMAVVADELSPLADLIEADVLSPAAEHRDDHAAMFDVEGDSGWNVPVPEPESSELDLAGTSCACTEIPQTGENDHREACEVFPASWPETSVDAAAASEFDGDSLRELEVEETGNETGTTPEAAFEFGRAPAWGAVARERHGWDRSRAWTRMRVRRDGRWGGHAPPPRRTRVRGRRRSTRHSRAPPSSARALKARNAFEQSFRRAPRAGAAR
jgi:hypothetical protein